MSSSIERGRETKSTWPVIDDAVEASASAAIMARCGQTNQLRRSGGLFPVLAASFLRRRPTGTLDLLFRGDAVETTERHHELVLVVGVAFSETPPRCACHAVRPSQYAVAVPQYGAARFRRNGRAPRRELVLILSQARSTSGEELQLRRADPYSHRSQPSANLCSLGLGTDFHLDQCILSVRRNGTAGI